MNKKAEVSPMEIIVGFIILLVVAAIIIYGFRTQFGKGTGVVEEKINSFDDTDKDGIANIFDKCYKEGPNGKAEFSGCSSQEALDAVTKNA